MTKAACGWDCVVSSIRFQVLPCACCRLVLLFIVSRTWKNCEEPYVRLGRRGSHPLWLYFSIVVNLTNACVAATVFFFFGGELDCTIDHTPMLSKISWNVHHRKVFAGVSLLKVNACKCRAIPVVCLRWLFFGLPTVCGGGVGVTTLFACKTMIQ